MELEMGKGELRHSFHCKAELRKASCFFAERSDVVSPKIGFTLSTTKSGQLVARKAFIWLAKTDSEAMKEIANALSEPFLR
jgi:hypothetical protein